MEISPAFRVVARYDNAQAPVMGVRGEVPPEEIAADTSRRDAVSTV